MKNQKTKEICINQFKNIDKTKIEKIDETLKLVKQFPVKKDSIRVIKPSFWQLAK